MSTWACSLARMTIVAVGMFQGIPVSAAGPDLSLFVGDYAGWAYLDDGGDFPLRLQVRLDEGKPAVLMSVPHQKAFNLTTKDAQTEGDTLTFERRNSEGKLWKYKAVWRAGAMTGQAALENNEARYEFEVRRSAEPLRMAAVDAPADYVGTYRRAGQTIVISAWGWGELRYFDTTTGRSATLFETLSGDFFVGPAMYVPSEVFARLRFERAAGGAVDRLIWTQNGQQTESLGRLRPIEEPFTFANGETRLGGTLIKPNGAGPHPAIVVMGGSDWTTRAACRREADIFVSFGLAALIYDQRGYGESTGDPTCSFEDTAADARASVAALKARSEIDGQRIGVFGRSRGGWFAPLTASRTADVAFVVVFVPPSVSPSEQENTRRLNEMRAKGFAEADISEAATYLGLLWKATATDVDWDRYVEGRAKVSSKPWFDIAGEYESRDNDDFRWSKLNMAYDPLPAIGKLTCPILAVFGERDTNVTPQQNLPLWESALKRANNRDFTLKVLPKADHGLRPSEIGVPPPKLHESTGYVPEVWRTVGDWLAARKFIESTTAGRSGS